MHGEALMSLIHRVTATHVERPTLGLNVRQRLVIQCLGVEGGRSMASIGQRLGVTPSTMTGLVDRLEEQGFVRREPHPSDRRATLLWLSRKGERAFAREVEFYRVLVDETVAVMNPDAADQVMDAIAALGRGSKESDIGEAGPAVTKRQAAR
ncbi:MAG: MarR family transcriptional regulator [bacterium]|nr:MarR family transcriptional regulator [bacterium]MCP5067725.1 MarR family transcriptional regulator [bacterium]